MEKYKQKTLEAYEQNAGQYAEGTADYLKRVPTARAMFGAFCAWLDGPRVCDIGCGPGRDVAYFREAGFDPLGVDISAQMLALVRERGTSRCAHGF